MYIENKSRTIVKSISWRFLATLTTFSLVYIFTGKLDTAIEIGALEVILKMMIYYFHERAWAKIKYGIEFKKPFVILITGLSGSGKAIFSKNLEQFLHSKKINVELLRGDKIRKVLPEFGYSVEHRTEHLNRILDFTKILVNNKTNVIVSVEAPFESSRKAFRDSFDNYFEIYMSAPLEFCKSNDEKGLYKKAIDGEIDNFVGVNIDYETPISPEFNYNMKQDDIDDKIEEIYNMFKERKMV